MLKGTGKGLVGLLVRPTGGLVDLASGTLGFVSRYLIPLPLHNSSYLKHVMLCRKTQVGNTEITDIRPPRFIGRDGVGCLYYQVFFFFK